MISQKQGVRLRRPKGKGSFFPLESLLSLSNSPLSYFPCFCAFHRCAVRGQSREQLYCLAAVSGAPFRARIVSAGAVQSADSKRGSGAERGGRECEPSTAARSMARGMGAERSVFSPLILPERSRVSTSWRSALASVDDISMPFGGFAVQIDGAWYYAQNTQKIAASLIRHCYFLYKIIF